jgi:flagellar biosynthesis chaperone FliJ
MDSEDEIEKMAEILAKDQGWSKLRALSVLQSRYQSERRLEEALVVQKIMDREESKPEETVKGVYDES